MTGAGPEERLFVYGTLAPGRSNHRQLDGLTGDWRPATAVGRLTQQGWGAYVGFPAIVLDPNGQQVFASADLPAHWGRLDTFEGPGYRRVVTTVTLEDGTSTQAQVYEGLLDE